MGLIGNTGQAIKSGVVRKTAKLIEQSGRKVFLDPSVSKAAKGNGIVLADSGELARICELLMVIGGDGTVLKVARDTAGSNTPLLGVNAGRLGFLTTASTGELKLALDNLWAGKFTIDPMPLVEARGTFGGKKIKALALNDILIQIFV